MEWALEGDVCAYARSDKISCNGNMMMMVMLIKMKDERTMTQGVGGGVL